MRGRALALGGCVLAASFALLPLSASGAPPTDWTLSAPQGSNFGDVCVGRSSTKSFAINNNNNGQSLTITSISRPDSPASVRDFQPRNVSTPAPIPPGKSASFSLSFVPSAHGDRQAVYTATDSAGSSDTITVHGRGIDRRLSMDRSSVSFGEQRVGTRSPTQSFVIRNNGSDDVTVMSLTRRGAYAADFIVSSQAVPFSVAAGNFKTLTIAFQPKGGGLRNATLEIVSTACSSAKLVASLVGSGVVPNISIDPNPVDVGASPKGVAGKPTAVTLSNDGKAGLKITAIQVLGTDAADFALTGLPTMPVTVPAAGTLVFSVRMTPSEAGSRTATINVISDDPDAPAFSVLLRGSGGAGSPSPTASPSASPSATPIAKPTGKTSPQAIAKPSNDSLAVGLVVGGVIFVFGGLMVIRRFVAAPDED